MLCAHELKFNAEMSLRSSNRGGLEKEKSVFVTVGTTLFEDLVKASTNKKFCQLLVDHGYNRLTIQIGKGLYTPDDHTPPVPGLELSWYRYKPSLTQDMEEASLIISHGGSGSILESLSLGKPLIVVVNEALMDNHQTELAHELSSRGHLLYTTHTKLYETVKQLPTEKLVKFEEGKPEKLAKEIDRIMGFT